MNKPILLFLLLVATFFSATVLYGQTSSPQLDQRILILQFVGKWQTTAGQDTLETWDWHTYGKSYECTVERIIGGKVTPRYKNWCNIDARTKAFIGAIFNYGGWSSGWTGSFVSEKKLVIDLYRLSEPTVVTNKIEFIFNTPDSFTAVFNNLSGNTFTTLNFSRIK